MAELWSEEDIAALKDAIRSGTLSVSFSSGGTSRSRTFQNLAEMRSLLDEMVRDVRGTARSFQLRHGKGF